MLNGQNSSACSAHGNTSSNAAPKSPQGTAGPESPVKCSRCGGGHPGCVYAAGSLGCVAVPCENPHHRAEMVGQRAPAATWARFVALTGHAGDQAAPVAVEAAPAYRIAPASERRRPARPRTYTRRPMVAPAAPGGQVDLFTGEAA